jgi:hypothetical protein
MLESEGNSIIRGMDLMGHADFARRALELYVRHYTPEGYVRMDEWGYTLMGTGWHLWTLGDHYALNQDQDWLRQIAPEVSRACAFVLRQLEKTKRLDPRGEKLPEHGLVPPGVSADWNYYAYRFMAEGIYCAGLRSTALALGQIQYPGAEKMRAASEAFSQDILRAFQWAQARNPALRLPNGAWVQPYPSNIYVDAANHTQTYDTEIGAHHLLAQGILDLRTSEARAIMDHMEDVAFLQYGRKTFSPDRCEQDWFNLGGFSKGQPYYTRMPQIYALLDDVKPFIRSYFNTIPTVLSLENLCFWEGPHQGGAWNKTHETGYFLEQTRSMLLMERGEELWIAPLVTTNWLKDGMEISVDNAPSGFGKLSYQIRSAVANGTIDVSIDLPQESSPAQICVRLRHPEGKQAHRAEVSGGELIGLEAAVIRVKPAEGNRISLRVYY